MLKNVFVVSLDEFNLRVLRRVENADELEVRPLFTYEEVVEASTFSFDELFDEACRQLRSFNGKVDAIIGWWDFPTTSLVPALCHAFDLPATSLESVVKCEHKYWSRVVQSEVAPECVPGFCTVDPFTEDPLSNVTLGFPFWLKPIKGMSSHLAFRIENEDEFTAAIGEIRERVGRLGDPFDEVLRRIELPPEIAGIGGNLCLAEEIITGRQCTVEGYVYQGDVQVYGVVDTISRPYYRYQYPSVLPKSVKRRMKAVAERVIRHIGYDNATFNMEFFWDRKDSKLWLLEVNPRLSQSHADLFAMVHGVPNFQIMVDLALGREPHFVARNGRARCAAKFFLTRFSDAVVRKVPDEETIHAIEKRFPGTDLNVRVPAGAVLSELPLQEAYGHELADVFVGGDDQEELLRTFRAVRRELPFRFAKSPHKKNKKKSELRNEPARRTA